MVAKRAAPREEPDMIEKAPPPGTAGITKRPAGPQLERTTLRTSRLLDFCSQKELIAQTGHQPGAWPLVILKELIDNALDACEEADIAPEIDITVDDKGITVRDNGPGLPQDVIADVLDFSVRVSSREPYVAPDRGAQGNALKTLVAMPFVLDGKRGRVKIRTQGTKHRIDFGVDPIRQKPVINHTQTSGFVKSGTEVRVLWPVSACSKLENAKEHFLQIARDFTWLNPHLTLSVNFKGDEEKIEATDRTWRKWRPSDPTSPHWYELSHFERLVTGYIAHDQDNGASRTVREVTAEFRGLAGSAKQKKVLAAADLQRAHLSDLVGVSGVDRDRLESWLQAMKDHSKPVKPKALGVIGEGRFRKRFEDCGCMMESFQHKQVMGTTDGMPWVIETAFGYLNDDSAERRIVTGINWSAALSNPFRELGKFGDSLDSVLSRQYVSWHEPVIFVLHMVCPRVEYTDRGKSAVVIAS